MTTTMTTTTLASSQEIRDRGSTFVGYVYRTRDVQEARDAMRRHQDRDRDRDRDRAGVRGGGDSQRGPYVMGAWRVMVLKEGRTGLSGPDDFVVQDGGEDGGETGAGRRVLGVMQREGVLDAVVVVCRWFGGTLLGPVRWTHIETCAGEVCRRYRKIEAMDEYVQTLTRLDDLLTGLRAELDAEGSTRERKGPDYRAMQDALDLTKAKRLIHARECAINNTKMLIEQKEKEDMTRT